jgi:HD-GYP domain-containing protein (c-di-GMP phosphodiesterase class II)
LMHKRPYKEAWHSQETIAHLRAESGSHFDPRVVDAFLSVIERGVDDDI